MRLRLRKETQGTHRRKFLVEFVGCEIEITPERSSSLEGAQKYRFYSNEFYEWFQNALPPKTVGGHFREERGGCI